MRRWPQYIVPLLILLGAAALRALDPTPVEELRLKVFDNFQRLKPREWRPAPVTIVDIDDDSLRALGQWPWPRTLLAQLVGRIQESGAAVVALDIVLPEPDRTSPDLVLQAWPDLPETRALRELVASGRLLDHDRILARTVAEGRVVTGFAQSGGATGGKPPAKAGFAVAGLDPKPFLFGYRGAVPTLPAIAEAAAGSGAIDVVPESDGVIRRVPLLIVHDATIYPSLAAEALRVAQGASTYVVKAAGASGVLAFGEHTGISEVRIGALPVPTDPHGRIWLYDTGPIDGRSVPAWQVLGGELDSERIAGHIVLVGTSAAGLKDLRASPLDPAAAGVTLHAQIIEQILLGELLQRPDWAGGLELVFMLALGAAVLIVASGRHLGAASSALLAGLALAVAIGFSWLAFERAGMLVDPIYPALAVLGVYLSASLLRYMRTEQERRHIRNAFAFYMAPAMVERLAERPELLRLGGEMRELTLLFCDIRGFTTISEQFTAEELTQFINRFLTPMTDVILRSGGTIDKYMGDCIMAMWNAPLDDPGHARHACEAALAMRAEVDRLNLELRVEAAQAGRPHHLLRVGIGINTGVCCVGNMGSAQRFDYSALGDEVNLASRLEGQCKAYGVDTIIGENSRAAAPDLACLELDLVQVKGKTRPVRIHALLGGPALARQADFLSLSQAHGRLLEAYRGRDWDRAEMLIERCREAGAPFGLADLYALYRARLDRFRAAPPDPGWDGAYVSLDK